jgi:hypothetical protein
MFKHLINSDFVEYIKNKAVSSQIKIDRLGYVEVFKILKEKLSGNDKLIISDTTMIYEYIAGMKISNVEKLIIYTRNPKQISVFSANVLHALNTYVQVKEVIPLYEYDINYDGRPIVHIYKLDMNREIEFKNIFYPIFIKKLPYFPPEIELIDIYRKLYNPINADEYHKILELEKFLYNSITSKRKADILSPKKNISKPSINNPNKYLTPTNINCKKKRINDVDIISKLLIDFLHNENYIIIGQYAYDYLNKQPKSLCYNNRLQIISEKDIETDYMNISLFLSKKTNNAIYYKKKLLHVPKDSMLLKYTFYIKYPGISSYTEKPFLDIYNCASYEMISYTSITDKKNNLKIGSCSVLLRFLFIDLWLLRILYQLKIIDNTEINHRGSLVFDAIKYIKTNNIIRFDDSYLGINLDYKIYTKIKMHDLNIKKTSYAPEQHLNSNKSYKIVSSS